MNLCIKAIILSFIFCIQINAQLTGNLYTGKISELDAVQTPENTFISASMEVSYTNEFGYRTLIHRSTDNGETWKIIDSLETHGIYETIGDPVLSVDNNGKIYLVVMDGITNNFTKIHLTLYTSDDDGESWSIESYPYDGLNGADTPDMRISDDGIILLSYTNFKFSNGLQSHLDFMKSHDNGKTWSPSVMLEHPYSNGVVGSNFNFSNSNQISLAYGDLSNESIFFIKSQDMGDTWSIPIEIPCITDFVVNKVISQRDKEHLCILSHKAHDIEANIYCSYSHDNGLNWDSYTLAEKSAYAEGFMDELGNVHVSYNQIINDTFKVNYVYSIDSCQTFSKEITLYSEKILDATNLTSGAGESQSMILGMDKMIHIVFTDYSDNATAKHLIFAPKITPYTIIQNETNHIKQIKLFPNPAIQLLNVETQQNAQNGGRWIISNYNGKTIDNGEFSCDEFSIELPTIPDGYYLLKILSNNKIHVQPFIKAK